METHMTTTKETTKKVTPMMARVLMRWASSYINAMTKALYPESDQVQSKNDRHRMWYK